jgi:hypothetical protein
MSFCARVGRWAGGFVVNSRGGLRVSADRPGDYATSTSNMKILDTPRSGKCGQVVAFRSRFGLCLRELVIPHNTITPARQFMRAAFGHHSQVFSRKLSAVSHKFGGVFRVGRAVGDVFAV